MAISHIIGGNGLPSSEVVYQCAPLLHLFSLVDVSLFDDATTLVVTCLTVVEVLSRLLLMISMFQALDCLSAQVPLLKWDMIYKMRGTRMTPVAMAKNQKIDLHPKVCAKTPPSKGPNAGPNIELPWNKAIYFPLSPGSAISEIVPLPIDITADPPVACKALSTSSNQYADVGQSARPIFAPR